MKLTRFCLDRDCGCSQHAVAKDPCWNCGGETSNGRPPWWPNTSSAQTVRQGSSWDLSEETVEEGSPA